MIRNFLLTLAALSLPAFGQSTIKDALVKHWAVTGEFTLEVAKAMPAASYNFRPVPEEMSFGQVMAHIALADLGACANASGMPRPAIPEKLVAWSKDTGKVDVDRDSAIQFLSETFEFCNKAIAGVSLEKLDAKPNPARPMTGYEWLWSYFTHTAHHRGQAEVYLRVKGIKPPEYKF